MSRNKIVSVDQLAPEIEKILTVYHKDVVKGVKRESKKSMRKLVKETKATAPVGKREQHYRDSITSTLLKENAWGACYVWYVKAPNYRLSHLLEHGHATRNGGRTIAYHFIENAYTPIEKEYLEKVKAVLQNGS